MNDNEMIEKMITEVEQIEKEVLVAKYSGDGSMKNAMKKDAVARIYKKVKEVVTDEN